MMQNSKNSVLIINSRMFEWVSSLITQLNTASNMPGKKADKTPRKHKSRLDVTSISLPPITSI
jgi:hypothetical protein